MRLESRRIALLLKVLVLLIGAYFDAAFYFFHFGEFVLRKLGFFQKSGLLESSVSGSIKYLRHLFYCPYSRSKKKDISLVY